MDQNEITKGIELLEELFEVGAFDQKYKKIRVNDIIKIAKNKKVQGISKNKKVQGISIPSEVFGTIKNNKIAESQQTENYKDTYHNLALSRTDCTINSDIDNITNMNIN